MESTSPIRKEPHGSFAEFKKAIFFNPFFVYDPTETETCKIAKFPQVGRATKIPRHLSELFLAHDFPKGVMRPTNIIPDILSDPEHIKIEILEPFQRETFYKREPYSQLSFSGAWGQCKSLLP